MKEVPGPIQQEQYIAGKTYTLIGDLARTSGFQYIFDPGGIRSSTSFVVDRTLFNTSFSEGNILCIDFMTSVSFYPFCGILTLIDTTKMNAKLITARVTAFKSDGESLGVGGTLFLPFYKTQVNASSYTSYPLDQRVGIKEDPLEVLEQMGEATNSPSSVAQLAILLPRIDLNSWTHDYYVQQLHLTMGARSPNQVERTTSDVCQVLNELIQIDPERDIVPVPTNAD